MISSILLGVLALTALIAAGIYFLGVQPARIIEKWAAGLSNGGHFPERPDVKGLYWLLPIHRELQRVADKISGLKKQLLESKDKKTQDEFLYHCVLASLMEGIMVVDRHGVITMVNAEFINIFQLTQSPLQRTMLEVIRDRKLQSLIADALTSGRVQSSRITRPNTTEVGRPPVMEVSAVPIRTQKELVSGVIVLFLPPPDRTRILQLMKRHSLRLDNLVNELMLSGTGQNGKWVLKKEPIDLREFAEEIVSIFASKSDNNGIKATWKVAGDVPPLFADSSYLQLAMIHLLVNLASDLDRATEVNLLIEASAESISIGVTFVGGTISENDFRRALGATSSREESNLRIIGSGPGLSLVREIIELHGGTISVREVTEDRVSIVLNFTSLAHQTK